MNPGVTDNPIFLRLNDIEIEFLELKSKRDRLFIHWNNEKDLIREIRVIQEDVYMLKSEAEKYERDSNLAKVAELRYGNIPDKEKKILEKSGELADIRKTIKLLTVYD